ncbi:MAG: helix-turn-helix domain-containing protein [Actinomycetota bacterium]
MSASPEPIDSRSHRVLSGVSRVAVLEVLRASPGPMDVQAIAAQIGLHTNTVRSHLDQLMEADLVQRAVQARRTPGRPRLLFRATAQPDAEPADSYKVLAEILASGIRDGDPAPGGVAARAGRRWGQHLERRVGESAGPVDSDSALDRIVTLLDDVGFAPRIGDTRGLGADLEAATAIEMHRCPFYDVARQNTDIVCAVHLGLIQGALDQMLAPPTNVRLEPFVQPDLCLVHLASAVIDSPRASADETKQAFGW